MLLATTACGRIDFDAVADASSFDAIDAAPVTCSHDARFVRIDELAELNSATFGDGGLRLSADELTAYFHSDRPPYIDYGLMTATRPNRQSPFDAPVPMNQPGFFPFETLDGKTLVWDDSDDMLVATRSDTSTYDLSSASKILMSANSDQHAYVTADGTQLYYALDFALMQTDFPPAGPGTPLTSLNTGSERHPVVAADGLALYFGRMGVDENVMVSRRARTTDPWGAPTMIGELVDPLHTTGPTWISPDNCRLYLETTRPAGDYGHWVAERDPN